MLDREQKKTAIEIAEWRKMADFSEKKSAEDFS
jgi:hypothetical protein